VRHYRREAELFRWQIYPEQETKAMQTTAKITIYLQALGGKFLGPNAYKHDSIKLSITLQGNTLPIAYQLKPNGNDGG
jgi:hypothetical protein